MITFIVIVVVISLAGKALTKLASFVFLGLLNKILGGLFGGAKIALILSVIIMLMNKVHWAKSLISEEDKNQSILYQPVSELAPLVMPSLLTIEQETKDSESE